MRRESLQLLPGIAAVGITQIIGWGSTFHLPGVLGETIAADLGFTLTIALLGPTVMLVTLAGVSWFLSGSFERYGARAVMSIGSVISTIGLLLLAVAQGRISYLLPWVVLGAAGAGMLTSAAQIAVSDFTGDRARQSIGILTLFSGLAATIFWPLTNFLDDAIGWRATIVLYAAAYLVICLPLIRFVVPPRRTTESTAQDKSETTNETPLDRTSFWLMAGAIAANGFITWGFSLTLIPLFEDRGLARDAAVTIASSLGLIQISARIADTLGGRRWSGLTTGLIASAVLPLTYLLLLFGSGRYVIVAFICFYGLAGGAMAIARSTIPLAVFPRGAYAQASAQLALPMNLAFASAPPIFGAILTHTGANVALVVATISSSVAFSLLWILARRTPRRGAGS